MIKLKDELLKECLALREAVHERDKLANNRSAEDNQLLKEFRNKVTKALSLEDSMIEVNNIKYHNFILDMKCGLIIFYNEYKDIGFRKTHDHGED